VVGDVRGTDSFFLGGVFLKAVGTVAAAGLAAPASAQMIGLGEDDIWAIVVELAGLGDGGDAVFGSWVGRSHAFIFADVAGTNAGPSTAFPVVAPLRMTASLNSSPLQRLLLVHCFRRWHLFTVYRAGRAADARDWLGWAIIHCWACWIWGDCGSAVFQADRNWL
jgi:hypothetical protein